MAEAGHGFGCDDVGRKPKCAVGVVRIKVRRVLLVDVGNLDGSVRYCQHGKTKISSINDAPAEYLSFDS